MNFVDEQHVALFEIGEQRRKVACLRDHRPRRRPEIHPKLPRHDLGEGRLTKTGRPCEQHMIQRLPARPRRIDEHFEVRPHFRLPDELIERLRPQRRFRLIIVAFR